MHAAFQTDRMSLPAVAMKAFLERRLHFNTFLRGSRSGLTTSHYLRLMALALSDLIITLPLAAYFLHQGLREMRPWTSWRDVHNNFGQMRLIRQAAVPSGELTNMFLPRWLAPLSALLFFTFFGLSKEACDGYRSWWTAARHRIRGNGDAHGSSAKHL
jgi:pheromone a factor receptor